MGMSVAYLREEQKRIHDLTLENELLIRRLGTVCRWLTDNDVGRGMFLVETDYGKDGLWGLFCEDNPGASTWFDD